MATLGAVLAIFVARGMGAGNLAAFGAMLGGMLLGFFAHWFLTRGKS